MIMSSKMCLPFLLFHVILASNQSPKDSENEATISSHIPTAGLHRVRRQGGNFVRFGRGPSSFVRIGKLDPENHIDDENAQMIRTNRQMNRFIRIGRHLESGVDGGSEGNDKDWLYSNIKRPSGFVRIGKSNSGGLFPQNSMFEKRAPGFVRIGKDWDDASKRASSFVRIGKDLGGSDDDLTDNISDLKRAPGFVRIGKSGNVGDDLQTGGDKRGHGFVRIGKSNSDLFNPNVENDNFDDDEGSVVGGLKRSQSFVRIGKSNNENMEKRAPGFVRIGKDTNKDFQNKRAPGFVRIGKDFDEDISKRAPGFVRIGKSSSDNFELKRAPGFVRIGKSPFYNSNNDFIDPSYEFQKPSRSVFNDGFDRSTLENELIKRAPGFVRIGKSSTPHDVDPPIDKRSANFVRIGKDLLRAAAAHKRAMLKKNSGFVRIGKQPQENSLMSHSSERVGDSGNHFDSSSPIAVSRRGSAFVRIGKIPSRAFVPLTKDVGRMFGTASGRRVGYRRRSRNGESSFVRIG